MVVLDKIKTIIKEIVNFLLAKQLASSTESKVWEDYNNWLKKPLYK